MRRNSLITLGLMITLLVAFNAQATIWIVDNNPNTEIADFSNLDAAVTGASSGDTLYVMGSGASYGAATIDKQLFIFGPGYFLGQNDDTQAVLANAHTDWITFWSDPNGGLDADGSLITGMYIADVINVYADDITIKRNRSNFSGTYSINCSNTASNVLIIGNYIYSSSPHGSHAAVYVGGSSFVTIENNFIYKYVDSDAIYVSSNSTGVEIHYNVIDGDIDAYNSTIYSNIIYSGSFLNNGNSNSFSNNIGDGEQFGVENGNLSNVDMATVFTNAGSSDGWFILPDGSPAIGAGLNGEDCGMFGGPDPYILSGIPTIPTISSFFAPNTGSTAQGLPVEIRVKARQ